MAKAVPQWLEKSGCDTVFITTGSPCEHPYIEGFIGKLRDHSLNRELIVPFGGCPVVRSTLQQSERSPLASRSMLEARRGGEVRQITDRERGQPCLSAGLQRDR